MPHDVRQWPEGVFPGEMEAECPEAEIVIGVLLRRFATDGPSPHGYSSKNLGARLGGLWQINLRVAGRQVRVLYAPYGQVIVLFRIHKKSSPQEQSRAYEQAKRRKKEYEEARRQNSEKRNDGNRTLH